MANKKPTKLQGIVKNFETGDTIGVEHGGLGLSVLTTGDLLVASSSSTVAPIAAVAIGNVLISGGVGTIPLWGQLNLATHTTGVLQPVNGGLGLSSYTAGNYINAASSTTLQQRTPVQVLSDIGAASAVHNHSASEITSGLISLARLGSGVPSAGLYLEGNGSWSGVTVLLGNVSLNSSSAVTTLTGMNSITSTTFVGSLTGNATTATSATNATNATNASNLAITNDTTTSSTVYPVWATGASGSAQAKTSSTKLSFVPSTGVLSATSFSGAATLSSVSASGIVNITNATASNTETNGALVVAGGAGVGGDLYVGGRLIVRGVSTLGDTIGDIIEIAGVGAYTTFSTSTASTSSNQILATYDATVYRSAELTIQAVCPDFNWIHSATVLITHNGTQADFVEYGDIVIGSNCGIFTVDLVAGNVRLKVNPQAGNLITFKIVGKLTKL